MLVHGVADPVYAGVVSNGDVRGVHHDNLEVLIGGVLVHPIGVQHTKVGAHTASSLLSHTAEIAHELDLVNSLVLGLSVDDSLVVGALATSSAHSHAVHNISLLGLLHRENE